MIFPRSAKNLEGEGTNFGGPLPVVGGQPVPIVSTRKQLEPDVTTGKEYVEETPEQKAQRLAAMDAATKTGQSAESAILGTAPGSAAPPPPQPAGLAPKPAPAGTGLTGGIPQMATLPAQQDANKQAMDALAKEQADEKLREEARLNALAKERTDQAMANIAKAETDYAKASGEVGKKDDKGWLHNVLLALAQGAGAYGATLSHSPNYAAQIIENADKGELERKRANLEATFKRYQSAGARMKDIEPWRDREMGRIMAQQKARLDQLQKAVDVSLSRFPKAQLEAQAAIDAKRAEIEKTKMEYGKEVGNIKRTRSQRDEGTTQTTTDPRGVAGTTGKGPTESENKLALLGESMKDELKSIRSGEPLTSSDLETVQSDTLRAENADKAAESGGQLAGAAVSIGRKIDAVPRSRYSSLPEAKQKTLNAWDNAIEKYARMLTGAGMPAEEARRMSRQNGPMAGDTPGQIKAKLDRLEREAERMTRLAGPLASNRLAQGSPGTQGAPATKASAPVTNKELGRLSADEQSDYVAAKAVKPDSPDYKNAQAAIRKLEAKARGE